MKSAHLRGYSAHAASDREEFAFPITVTKNGSRNFTVQYGKQIASGLNYHDAAAEVGRSIMHALACDNALD